MLVARNLWQHVLWGRSAPCALEVAVHSETPSAVRSLRRTFRDGLFIAHARLP
jgi:hypothetical protein